MIQPVMGHVGLGTVLPDQTNSVSNNGQEDCSGNNIQATNPDISFNFPATYKNLLKWLGLWIWSGGNLNWMISSEVSESSPK